MAALQILLIALFFAALVFGLIVAPVLIFNLGRRTAKVLPWRRRSTGPAVASPAAPPLQDAPTDRIRVPLHENDTDLISRDPLEGQPPPASTPRDQDSPAR